MKDFNPFLPSFGLPGLHGRNHTFRPFFDTDGDGDGDEGGGDEGEGDGEGDTGEGDDDGEGDGDGESDGRPKLKSKATLLKDDRAMVQLPGMKKPVSVAQLRQAVAAAEANGASVAQIKKLTDTVTALQNAQRQPIKPKVPPRPQADPYADLEALEVLDGKSMAGFLRNFAQGNIGPVIKGILALNKEQKALRDALGPILQGRNEESFTGDITGAIAALKLPKVAGKDIDGVNALNDALRDLFLSYDPQDHDRLRQEFPKHAQARVQALRTFFRNYEKAEAEAKHEAMRNRFRRRGGNTSLTGKGKKLPTNSQLAEALFAGATNS